MPKIIKDLENKLMEEARRQVEQVGYGAMTIRSVAKACGVGVGTVYNYFPSKDDLLATSMLGDWKQCIAVINEASTSFSHPESVIRCIYDQLVAFAKRHQTLFRDEAASASFAGSFSRYHTMLRAQLAAPLQKFCSSEFASEFIAEAVLIWSMAGKSFDDIYGIIGKLF